ncbi:MAG: hypothetical protein WCF84_07110 [Anaerolineae bacterium]
MNRNANSWLLLLTLLAIMLLTIGCSKSGTSSLIATPAAMHSVQVTAGGFQILVPTTWRFTDRNPSMGSGATLIGSITSPTILNGAYGDFFKSEATFTSLAEVAEWGRTVKLFGQTTNRVDGYKELYTSPMTFQNEETWIREFTYTSSSPLTGTITGHVLDNYRLHQDHGIILRFYTDESNYQSLQSYFRQMIDSLTYIR